MLHPRRREGHGGECNYDESKNGSSGNNNPLSNPMALMTGGGGGDVFGNMGRHLQLSKDTPALSRSRLHPLEKKTNSAHRPPSAPTRPSTHTKNNYSYQGIHVWG